MSAQLDLNAAEAELQRLQIALEATRATVEKLSASTDIDELARIRLGGGVIDFTNGPLQQLQCLRLEQEVVSRAIQLKCDEVKRCRDRVAREALDALRNRRDEVVAEYYLACGQLARIRDKINELDEQARRYDQDCDGFEWQSFADRFLENAQHPSAGATDKLAHLVFTCPEPRTDDSKPFKVRIHDAA